MISIKQAVIVEGKYDKIKLSNFIDATIIPTNGFSVFKDKEKRKLISLLAEKNGLVVITDSDHAGMQIRSYLKNICKNGTITNVYVPQISGVEKRKAKASKQGYLGVEGLNDSVIIKALEKSGIVGEKAEKTRSITKNDMFTFGLSGSTNSALKRDNFSKFSNLPVGMSSSAFLDALNAVYSFDEFKKAVSLWQAEEDKN